MDRIIRLLTIEESARELHLSTPQALKLVAEGKLTASNIDGRCVLSEMQLMFFKRSHPALATG
ncbi:MAG TPA: hypothetical protein VIJ97_03475 [Candidatus Anoxymicrobiaceae bacterium]